MSELKGVAVGAGYFSQFHFDAWSRLDNVQLVAICDTDKDKAEQAAREFDVARHYDNFEKMLETEQPDFVDIITRPDSHLPLTQQAVDAGAAVICQKPLAPSFAEAQQLVNVAAEGNCPFMVHENFRFQPWYREIKRLLQQQVIGKRLNTLTFHSRTGDGWQQDAYLQRQPYFREMPRFLVFEMGVHFIDTFRYLAGEIDGVYANLRRLNPSIAGEDCGVVLFEFLSDTLGLWDANRFNEPASGNPRYTFGNALLEGDGGSIRLSMDGTITVQPLGQAVQQHEYKHVDRGFAGDCVLSTQRHFVDCLVDSVPFETSGSEYLKTLSVQEAVYESATKRQPLRGLASCLDLYRESDC